eukprot:GHVP01040088.1.p1 GENE.GHVP01040088.1~~GHVP01040088.1.p1  ORF type:complete len:108 (+),score=8.95 GHVP01040088.1:611-934(+)
MVVDGEFKDSTTQKIGPETCGNSFVDCVSDFDYLKSGTCILLTNNLDVEGNGDSKETLLYAYVDAATTFADHVICGRVYKFKGSEDGFNLSDCRCMQHYLWYRKLLN